MIKKEFEYNGIISPRKQKLEKEKLLKNLTANSV